jgi:hypothetical protein
MLLNEGPLNREPMILTSISEGAIYTGSGQTRRPLPAGGSHESRMAWAAAANLDSPYNFRASEPMPILLVVVTRLCQLTVTRDLTY